MIESSVVERLRRILLGTLLLGVTGTGTELLLLGHVESGWQLVPIVLLALALVIGVWHAAAPSRTTVRGVQTLMLLFVFSAGIGVGLHYDGNASFELEMYPDLQGLELAQKTVTGATPVLAPGTMALLGLIGIAQTYRHPAAGGPL